MKLLFERGIGNTFLFFERAVSLLHRFFRFDDLTGIHYFFRQDTDELLATFEHRFFQMDNLGLHLYHRKDNLGLHLFHRKDSLGIHLYHRKDNLGLHLFLKMDTI
jgi:hypothetical protein